MTVNSIAAELHAAAENGGVGAELLFPQAVADHDDGVAARDLILLRPEGAAQLGLDAHDAEEVAADEQAERQLAAAPRASAASPDGEAAEGDQPVKAGAAIADVDVLAIRAC